MYYRVYKPLYKPPAINGPLSSIEKLYGITLGEVTPKQASFSPYFWLHNIEYEFMVDSKKYRSCVLKLQQNLVTDRVIIQSIKFMPRN
jgi:hypothetical protein